MKPLNIARAFVAVLALASASAVGAVPRYVAQDLGTLGDPAPFPYTGQYFLTPWAINSSGQVSGDYGAFLSTRGFIYDGTTLHDLGSLGASHAEGINTAGQLTGTLAIDNYVYVGPYPVVDHSEHAYFYDGATMHDLGTLGTGKNSGGAGINASGWITGQSQFFGLSDYHAFLYSGGVMHDLGTLGGADSAGYAINDSGAVTGYAKTAAGANHVFVYDGSTMHDLNPAGWTASYGRAINASGEIAGDYVDSSGVVHAFRYDGTGMHELTMPAGALSSGAGSINAGGEITGFYRPAGSNYARGFLYDEGTVYDLNDLVTGLPQNLSIVLGRGFINDAGQIAALAVVPGAGTRVYLLTPVPVPVPAALWLFGAAVASLGRVRRAAA